MKAQTSPSRRSCSAPSYQQLDETSAPHASFSSYLHSICQRIDTFQHRSTALNAKLDFFGRKAAGGQNLAAASFQQGGQHVAYRSRSLWKNEKPLGAVVAREAFRNRWCGFDREGFKSDPSHKSNASIFHPTQGPAMNATLKPDELTRT